MTHLDLFSGIGGFALAVDRVWPEAIHTFCEIDPFCQQVLLKHWPDSKIYGDIRDLIKELEDCNIKQCGLKEKLQNKSKTDIEDIIGPITTETKQSEASITSPIRKSEGKTGELQSLKNMEENVLAVERQPQNFSISTTKTTMGMSKEKSMDMVSHTTSQSKKDSPTDTNSSAGIVTYQKLCTDYAHTKTVDIITGGFPCQGFSQAGKRKGRGDDRYLWPQMFRVIQLLHPRWVLAENVPGIITIEDGLVLEQIYTDLESEGYSLQPLIIPAVSVNAPHRRDRVWFVAHRTSGRERGSQPERDRRWESEAQTRNGNSDAKNSISQRSGGGMESNRQVLGCQSTKTKDAGPSWGKNWLEVATRLCRVDDELSAGMDNSRKYRVQRLKALGNAIVPAVAVQIMLAIKKSNEIH